MRFAYADPPYLGTNAKRIYGPHHDAAGDYTRPETHQALIDRLSAEYPDGWALSLHEPSLRAILAMCPDDVRVACWVKGSPSLPFKTPVQRHWEPVIWRGGRPYEGAARCGDWHYTAQMPPHENPNTSLQTDADKRWRVAKFGRKPRGFSFWMFDLLGARKGDELDDLFPGTGAVTAAWREFTGQHELAFLDIGAST